MRLEQAYTVIDILSTIKDAAIQMKESFLSEQTEAFHSLCMDVWDGVFALQQFARRENPDGTGGRFEDACICIQEAIKDIRNFVLTAPDKVVWKIEYELEPIIEMTAVQFFRWELVEKYPTEKEAFLNYLRKTDFFSVLNRSEAEENYACDLAIMVIGYNKLEYTAMCVDSIKRNLPQGISCEIVIKNHGSTDATKEYFENMEDVRVLNIAVNGAIPFVENKVNLRGRYCLFVSNDVVMGNNSIQNLYRCVTEHPDYGFVVPSTSNISNLQTIAAQYTTLEEFEEFARKNNQYDSRRQEQRVRLCNPLQIVRMAIWSRLNYEMFDQQCGSQSYFSFPDDRISLWMRRNRYKCILAKDAYCHHFGSVTLKDDLGKVHEQEKFYLEGRRSFWENYGVDPWGIGFCYDSELFAHWKISPLDGAVILGINCGLGSAPLKVKEILKEKGAKDVVLYNVTQEKCFISDLEGISDVAVYCEELKDIDGRLGRKRYDYIVVEGAVLNSRGKSIQELLEEADIRYGEMAVRVSATSWQLFERNDCNPRYISD